MSIARSNASDRRHPSISGSYQSREFVTIGYFVKNDFGGAKGEPLDLRRVTRTVMEPPRVSEFAIDWETAAKRQKF